MAQKVAFVYAAATLAVLVRLKTFLCAAAEPVLVGLKIFVCSAAEPVQY